ncbi:MAG: hypothetical protein RL518_1481 [Pseudomonadota bacterium]|jgi:ribosomal protein S18 acetylase RimI-like enzyme
MIRVANIKDSLSIAEIHVASWKHTYAGQVPQHFLDTLSVATREASWTKTLTAESQNIHIFEDTGVLKGFVYFGLSLDSDKTLDQTGEVYAIYLRPGCERRGIGTALWRSAVDELSSRNLTQVSAWVLDTNLNARGFYERCGCLLDGAAKNLTIGDKELLEVRYTLNRN